MFVFVCLFVFLRKLVEQTMMDHENTKEARRKLQEYKQKLGEKFYDIITIIIARSPFLVLQNRKITCCSVLTNHWGLFANFSSGSQQRKSRTDA